MYSRRRFNETLLPSLLFLLSVPAIAAEPSSREVDLHISRQPISRFLQRFSAEAGVQYGYLPTNPAEEWTEIGPLDGRYTIESALNEVFEDTGFSFVWINEGTLSIISPPVIELPSMPHYATSDKIEVDAGTLERATKKLQTMVVVSTRLENFDSLPEPSRIFERRDIEALGVATLPEVFRYLSSQPYSRAEIGNSGDQRVELRGLGRDTTLVLINGRRVGGSSVSFDIDAFDLNTIPLSAVERIEVILDTPPMSVGADAIGGMVNIVLKGDATDPVAEVRYGVALGGGAERRASMSAGLVHDRVRLSTVVDFFQRDDLPGAERDRWRNQDYRRFGSLDFRSLTTDPGNVSSLTGENLPGLSSRFAAVPSRESGTPLEISDFAATAGTRTFDSLRRFRSIVPERERISAVGSMEWELSSDTLALGEFFFTNGTTLMRDIPFGATNVVVPSTNPFNPFDMPVLVNFLPSTLGPRLWESDNEFLRALAAVQGGVGRWRWEVATLYTDDSTRVTQSNELSAARVASSLSQTDPDQVLNVFDDGPGGSVELLRSLLADPVTRSYSTHMMQVTASLHGSLLHLRSGDLSAALGGEWRRLEVAAEERLLGDPERTSRSAFLEFHLPFVDHEQNIPGISQLGLSLAGRLDDFSDVGSIGNTQFALTWDPFPSWSIRATYGTGYRAPSLFDLNQPVIRVPGAVPDLKRNNEIANIITVAGGNPDLIPTKAQSSSLGVSYTLHSTFDLNLSATYWQSDVRDRVSPFLLQNLLAHDDLFPDRVVRAPQSASDVALGLPGILTSLDVRPANTGNLKASGVDAVIGAAFDTPYGRFTPALSVTWMDRFTVMDFPGIAATERVGLASVFGTIPDWYAIAAVAWDEDPWSASITTRFVSAYSDVNVLQNQLNGRRVPSQVVLDLQVSLSLDRQVAADSFFQGFRLSAGVTNLLDKRPAFAEVGVDMGFDSSQGDLRGRFGYVRLTKQF